MLRIALILASIANVAAGLGLAGLWFKFRHDPGMPIVVLFVAGSLFIQGGFTLGHLRGLWRQWNLFVAGEGAAALVGAVAILQGVIYNLHPTNGDYEWGPLIAATLMTTQATIGLIFAARSGEFGVRKNA
ncbi:MAG: hypothetical protein M3P26_02065 [Gemmatimonadota bacterium]|nr:hypothetical protein [Gemmatimonadota bacterium]